MRGEPRSLHGDNKNINPMRACASASYRSRHDALPTPRSREISRAALVLVLGLLWALPSAADETIGGSCTGGGASAQAGNGNNVWCNGSTYQYPAYWFGSTTSSCGSTTAGMMQWTGSGVSPNNTMEFCNGSSWTAICTGATSGTVSAGTQYQLGYYATTGSTISGDSKITTDGFNVLSVLSTTITASDPVLNLSQTWNSSGVTFTALNLTVTNTASAAASLLMALKASSTS